ncbi:hypothetical protein TEA_000219 [Camellia sinensis var. sinensis]|uniref:Uncharacterized protein n=1 Tax=Camellia sinensis var. sinensis TaxID=542762 RepID=A0A4S4DFI7_CAMSN|nr:hypothetical protein TEA_000219 [Camellia sinensis var. sinensis]
MATVISTSDATRSLGVGDMSYDAAYWLRRSVRECVVVLDRNGVDWLRWNHGSEIFSVKSYQCLVSIPSKRIESLEYQVALAPDHAAQWRVFIHCTTAMYDHSTTHAVFVIISVLLIHFLLIGVVLATCCWLYAFDVHCNSFFPMFVMLYVIHYFLSPLLVAHGFIPVLLSNLLFMVAASYYHYLNFLGYDVLPFLERTTFFLYPIGVVIVLSPILILSGFNPSRYFMNMYFSQWQ